MKKRRLTNTGLPCSIGNRTVHELFKSEHIVGLRTKSFVSFPHDTVVS